MVRAMQACATLTKPHSDHDGSGVALASREHGDAQHREDHLGAWGVRDSGRLREEALQLRWIPTSTV